MTSDMAKSTAPVGTFQSSIPLVTNLNEAMEEGEHMNLGYEQELDRQLNWWSTFCIGFGQVALLPSLASILCYSMRFGGTGGMIWGGLCVMIPLQCLALSMAELSSAMPIAAGTHYFAAALAPEGYQAMFAYLTGWSSWLSQVTAVSALDYALSCMILNAFSLSHDFEPTDGQKYLLSSALMLFHGFLASMSTKNLAWLNTYSTLLNVLSLVFFCFVIPLWKAPNSRLDSITTQSIHSPSRHTHPFHTFRNPTPYPNFISLALSLQGIIWLLIGLDSSCSLAEETSNPRTSCPRAIMMTSSLTLGFAWLLQTLIAITVVDIEAILNSKLDQAWVGYLLERFPSRVSLALLGLTISCGISVGQAAIISVSRITFAYARDDFFSTLSPFLKTVNPSNRAPTHAVWFSTGIGMALLPLSFGGASTISAVFSFGSVAALVSYFIPIACRISCPSGAHFTPGPWHLGRASRPIGFINVCFLLFMIPVLCLPVVPIQQLTFETMNWTPVGYGFCLLIMTAFWILSYRKWYKGPKVARRHRSAIQSPQLTEETRET